MRKALDDQDIAVADLEKEIGKNLNLYTKPRESYIIRQNI
jgi:hypothetical protein